MTAPQTYESGAIDTVFNGTITGNQLVVNSIASGPGIIAVDSNNLNQLYGGTVPFGGSTYLAAAADATHFTLNNSPGNQTASFSTGNLSSATALVVINSNWATWANNHGVKIARGYEGCYSPDYGVSTATDLLKAHSRWAPSLSSGYQKVYDDFLGRGASSFPSGFTTKRPSLFLFVGGYPSGNVWQTLEDIYISTLPTAQQPPGWTKSSTYN